MQYQPLIGLLILLQMVNTASFINTTQFWMKELNQKIEFQVYAGYEQIDWTKPRGKSGMHYQLFSAVGYSPNQPLRDVPLIIWLGGGGPGNSSLAAAFSTIGPFRIEKNKVKLNNYSWNSRAHLLFIDQPLNVGFSYSGNRTGKEQVKSSDQTSHQLLNFLYGFKYNFPILRGPVYIAGQFYSGHYVTSFAHKIALNQSFQLSTGIKLSGVIIGNGWVDPVNQMNFYGSLLYSSGIVSDKIKDVCSWYQDQATLNIVNQNYINGTFYWNFLTNDNSFRDQYLGGMNYNNFKRYDNYEDMSYLNFLKDKKQYFGVPEQISFISGNSHIDQSLQKDISMSYASQLTIILRKIKVLIYQGQYSYKTTTAGALNFIEQLSWTGLDDWRATTKKPWIIDGQIVGWVKKSGNLQFVLVNSAGQSVALDQPNAALKMIQNFIQVSSQPKQIDQQ